MKKIYACLLHLFLLLTVNSFAQTVTLNAILSGKVTSADVKTNGDLTNISSGGDRGYLKFDLSSIPGGATILSASLKFTTVVGTTSSASTANKITTSATLDAATAGAGFYAGLTAATTASTGVIWNFATPSTLNTVAINAAGIADIQTRLTSGNITLGAIRGSTNVYVIAGYNNATVANQPQLIVTYGFPCSGTPTAGTVSGPSAVCSGIAFNLTNTGATSGTGLKFSWQSSTDGTSWTNIDNTSSVNLTKSVSQTVATFYRMVDTCTASAGSAISNVVNVLMNSPNTCYCVTSPTFGGTGDIITNVTMGTLNNTTTYVAPAYFTTYNNVPVDLGQTTSQNISITLGTDGTQHSAVWIDFNQNGLYDATENVALSTAPAAGSATVIYSLAIPLNATLGNTRMRVRGGSDDPYTAGGACAASSYGETEDYLVNIVAPPTCIAPTAPITTVLSATAAGFSWTAASPVPASGYQWAVTTSSTPPASGTVTTGTTASSNTLIGSTTYYLHVRSNCGSGFSAWVTSGAFTTPCIADNVPYIMPIETVTTPAIPACTSIENVGNLPNTWISASFTTPAILAQFTMPVIVYLYNSTNPANDWLFTNGINLTAGTSYTLKYKFSNDLGTTFPEAMEVKYGTSNTSVAMTLPLANYPVINSPTATSENIVFTPTTSGVFYFGFHAYSDADQDALILDDVSVIVTPSCLEPTALTASSVSSTSVTLNWAAVATAANGYEYTIDNVATAPTVAGTPVATNTVVVAGSYTTGSTYYAHVRSKCSGTDFSSWTTISLIIPPNCTTNSAPANGATGLNNPIALSWVAAPSATSYNVFLSSDGGTTYANVGNIAGTTANLNVVSAGNYFWYVQPSNGGLASGCSSTATSFTTASPDTNDQCSNAANLTVSNGFCALPVLGTLQFADSTGGLGGASCAASALKFDVWYKVAVPSTGNVVVQTSAVNTNVTDLVLQAYSGACNALTLIDCNDDGNPDPFPSSAHSKLGLIGRTPGEIIYFRVMPYSSLTNAGAFSICAFDTTGSVIPPVALGTANTCTNAVTVLVDSAYKYTWATFKDASGNIIAQVYPNGNILGSTTVSVFNKAGAVRVDASGKAYLNRNITIAPTTQPTSGTVLTRLYYTEAEFLALQTADPSIISNTDLNITKTQTSCSPVFGTVGTFLSQVSNSLYGTTDRTIDVSTASFSEFFIKGGAGVLPVSIEFFRGSKLAAANYLDWKVTCTSAPTVQITLERSADGRNFTTINNQTETATRCLQGFNYTDNSPLSGFNYYRLKTTSPDGKIGYSTIVVLLNKEKGFELISLAPNPVKNTSILSLTTVKGGKIDISVSDIAGKVISKQSVIVIAGNNPLVMNFTSLGAGTYIITAVNAEGELKTTKFVKY